MFKYSKHLIDSDQSALRIIFFSSFVFISFGYG
jgi:hypothetical protein